MQGVLGTLVLCTNDLTCHAADDIGLYFGVGNFHHLQHEITLMEALILGRRGPDITALAGFAGGNDVGEYDRVCYKLFPGRKNYAGLGHAEAVSVYLPQDSVADFARLFFGEVTRRRKAEDSAQYRPMIGVRGGKDSPVYHIIENANSADLQLVDGDGNDPSAFGEGKVYIYDSRFFPFRAAELYNQFANDITEYEVDYAELRNIAEKLGTSLASGCV